MAWKVGSHTSSVGDSATIGQADFNKISNLFNGDVDVDTVTINSPFIVQNGKLQVATITNTGVLTLPTSTDTLVGRATTDTLTNKTLTAPIISTISNSGTITLPTSTDTLVGKATTDTLTNKTLTTPIIATISNSGTLTLPTSTDTLVGRDTTDTLTNKTLTAPIISTISNTGTVTLFTSSDTVVGKATTDTLTNKTLTLPIISSISNGGTVTIPSGADTLIARTSTDTLTNKTLTSPVIATIVNSGNNLTLPTTTDTIVGRATTDTLTNKTLTTPTLTTPIINGVTYGDVAITNADSPYTVLATKKIIRADATSGAITINLPTAVGIAGREYHIFRTDIISSTNLITIDANSTETIDSNLTYRLYPAEWIKLESDGANWQIIGRSTPNIIGYYFDKGSTDNRRYYAGYSQNIQTTTTAPAINTLWALPFIVGKTTKFDTISFRMTTNQTGNARAGIYLDNGNCYPGALYFDTGAISVTAGTLKDTTITSALQVFQPGLYWLSWECDVANLQFKGLGTQTNLLNILASLDTFQTAASGYGYSVAHTFGALPDPYTASATALSANPGVGVPIPAIGLRAI